MLETIRKPDSGLSKFRFWIRVLITSNGADTTNEALAPQIDATKFCAHVAELYSFNEKMCSLAKAEPPKSYIIFLFVSILRTFCSSVDIWGHTANDPGALRAAVQPAPR